MHRTRATEQTQARGRGGRVAPLLRSLTFTATFSAACTLLAGVGGCGRSDAGQVAEEAASAAPSSGATTEVAAAVASAAPSGAAEDEPPPQAAGTPAVVDLSGVATPPPPAPEGSARLGIKALSVRAYARPTASSKVVGYLRAGAVVALESAESAGTEGCSGGWRKLKPHGYVCVGKEATLSLDDEIVRAASRRPDVTQKLPYMYGVVTRGGPAYARLPGEADLKRFEPGLKKHLAKWEKDKVSGAGYGLDVWQRWADKPAPPALEALEQKLTEGVPWYLQGGRQVPNLSGLVKSAEDVRIDEVSRRNGVAFVDSFLHEGRRYNVSTDLRVAPADRFRPIRGSDFHGWEIGKEIDFPFALIRRPGGKTWRLDGKKLVEAGDLAWRSAVPLTGKQQFFGGKLHYETKDGAWVDDRHAGRIDAAKKMPAWGKNGEKWLDINLTKQVLVAYEGTKAVYATLISSGEAGLADHEGTTATRKGIFRIHTKHVSITMDSDTVGEEFELRDVPYVQYFQDGYALHGAYWHDSFGRPKSHGCINLAPEDARRIFWWTEPQVPPGWHGAARSLTGTVVFVHP
ncbi:L,D-transpeptidase [Chondromyces apiculatus]|nr:L,D-transpeptidase [Chondromyces apiculatus]